MNPYDYDFGDGRDAYFSGEEVLDDCDCDEPDVDTITGEAHCYRCGRSWFLSSEQLALELRLNAEAQEYYDRENHIEHSRHPKWWIIRQTRRVRQRFERMRCCNRRFTHAANCDEIPF